VFRKILKYIKKIKKNYEGFSSAIYWEARNANGGNSGYGSYGRLAEFKASTINKIISNYKIRSVVDLGCGDGNQLSLLVIKKYIGIDISRSAVKKCSQKFINDKNKQFFTWDYFKTTEISADASLSLDVIFHLVEDEVFEAYMKQLFKSSNKYCIIYSSNDETLFDEAVHVKHRKFTEWIVINKKDWTLIDEIPNKYPYDGTKNSKDSSFSNFYIYKLNNIN
jgi:SAM-dependent methyltransferase